MNIVQFDVRQTTIMAILVLYLGKYLPHKIRWLQTFNIPEAVSGGGTGFPIVWSLVWRIAVTD